MILNIEHITESNRFWIQVNALAKEAFPSKEYLAPSKLVKMAEADNFTLLQGYVTDRDRPYSRTYTGEGLKGREEDYGLSPPRAFIIIKNLLKLLIFYNV